jgi:hypothetical protein
MSGYYMFSSFENLHYQIHQNKHLFAYLLP